MQNLIVSSQRDRSTFYRVSGRFRTTYYIPGHLSWDFFA